MARKLTALSPVDSCLHCKQPARLSFQHHLGAAPRTMASPQDLR